MFANAISTFSDGLQGFQYVHAEINFLPFYFDPDFVEKIHCISESSVAMPKSVACMCYCTFERCTCIQIAWLEFDCICCEDQFLPDFFRRTQLYKDVKNRFVGY